MDRFNSITPNVAVKYIASFLKKDWELSDYPVRFRERRDSDHVNSDRIPPPRWVATIYRWPGPAGTGNTKDEAYSELERHFLKIKENPEPLYRPGTARPLVFASSDRVDQVPELRDDFVRKILDCEWAFMSDEASLWDFHSELDNEAMFLRTGEVYGVDVSYIPGAIIADILQQIMDEIHEFPEQETPRMIRMDHDAHARHIMALPEYPWNPYL